MNRFLHFYDTPLIGYCIFSKLCPHNKSHVSWLLFSICTPFWISSLNVRLKLHALRHVRLILYPSRRRFSPRRAYTSCYRSLGLNLECFTWGKLRSCFGVTYMGSYWSLWGSLENKLKHFFMEHWKRSLYEQNSLKILWWPGLCRLGDYFPKKTPEAKIEALLPFLQSADNEIKTLHRIDNDHAHVQQVEDYILVEHVV